MLAFAIGRLRPTSLDRTLPDVVTRAAIAQLGERQTEDMKVPGSRHILQTERVAIPQSYLVFLLADHRFCCATAEMFEVSWSVNKERSHVEITTSIALGEKIQLRKNFRLRYLQPMSKLVSQDSSSESQISTSEQRFPGRKRHTLNHFFAQRLPFRLRYLQRMSKLVSQDSSSEQRLSEKNFDFCRFPPQSKDFQEENVTP